MICPQCKRCRFDPWVGKIPWRRRWQPTPVSLPGKSHGQRNRAGYTQFMGSQRVGYDWMTNYSYEMETVSSLRMIRRMCFLQKGTKREVLLEINQRVTPSLTSKMPTLKYSFHWQNGTQGLHSENTFKQTLLGSKVGVGLRETGPH